MFNVDAVHMRCMQQCTGGSIQKNAASFAYECMRLLATVLFTVSATVLFTTCA